MQPAQVLYTLKAAVQYLFIDTNMCGRVSFHAEPAEMVPACSPQLEPFPLFAVHKSSSTWSAHLGALSAF